MKRIILIIISVLMISSAMLLVACGQPGDDKTHDENLKEISDLNRANNEKRQTFLSSEIYAEAYAYLSNTLDELLPESEYEISLEPGSLFGDDLSKDELLGKWKGEFIFDGIWELVYVTIDTDGTVTVQPYKINYGDGWDDESGNPSYDFSGSFDINRVYGSGGYGKIDIYQFIESGGTQYGIGELKTTSGNKAEVYLVRP